jgi:hypothetical protein
MLGSSKRVLALLVAGLCSLLIAADLHAGIIRRGQNRRAGIFARRSNNRKNTTTVTTSTAASGTATSGQTATAGTGAGLSVRGQSPDGTASRTGASTGANSATPSSQLPPPGGAPTRQPQ